MTAIVVAAVSTAAMYCSDAGETKAEQQQMQLIELWQVDGFEGGKGSRADYLSKVAEKCFANDNTYIKVTSLTAQSALRNFETGRIPDIISYNAGFVGIERLINDEDFTYKTWCSGSYCFITCDAGADFTDINSTNTVVNAGKDNLAEVAAALEGLSGAVQETPVNAYLKVLDGSYKYLLGTQRDVFRFRARESLFKVRCVESFSDLYQNISILTANAKKYRACMQFTDFLLTVNDVSSVGLFSENTRYEDEVMSQLSKPMVELSLRSYCSQEYKDGLLVAARSGDINKIKNLLK